VGAVVADGPRIVGGGILQGWTPAVYAVVFISAAGGLLVALFLRHLDSVLKTFASTSAIVLSTAASVPLFGFAFSTQFALGAAVVLGAIALYSAPGMADPPALTAPPLGRLMSQFFGGCAATSSAWDRSPGVCIPGVPASSARAPAQAADSRANKRLHAE
jgi:hypothetical protein